MPPMLHGKRVIIIALWVCAIAVLVCSARTIASRTKRRQPSAWELLAKYAETQDKLRSYIIKSESSSEFSTRVLGRRRRIDRVCELRYDGRQTYGNRVKLCKLMWGQVGSKFVPKDQAVYTSWLWDGENYMRYSGVPKQRAKADGPAGKVRPFMSGDLEITDGKLTSRMYGTTLTGFFSGSEERVDVVLRQARSISVRDKTERIKGVDCYVIDAETSHGQYKLWIDPEHGHNIATAHLRLSEGQGHLFYGEPFEVAGKRLLFTLENVRFKRIDDIWVPVEADMSYRRDFHRIGRVSKSNTHVKFTRVSLNPDHDALGSFGAGDIPDGAKVIAYVDLNNGIITAWDPEYRWACNAELVVDSNGRWVKYDPGEGLLPVIKALPELRELELDIDPSQTRNKRILLCFCDMTQPSSRHCVLHLREQAAVLRSKDIIVALLQCSTGSMHPVNAWVRKNKIGFPVGRIHQMLPKVLRAWCIEALPWLVLSDATHAVVAEGFGLNALNQKIEETSNARQ